MELLSKKGLQTLLESNRKKSKDVTLESSVVAVPYPFYDFETRSVTLVAAIHARMGSRSGEDGHTVVLAKVPSGSPGEPPGYALWCGDALLDGKLPESEALSRIDKCKGQLLSSGSKSSMLYSTILDGLPGVNPPSGGCHFWATWKTSRQLCGHTAMFLQTVLEDSPSSFELLENLYENLLPPKEGADRAGSAAYGLSRLAFRVPVLIEGDRGSGKTKQVRDFCRQGGFRMVEQGGHESLESADLLGYVTPLPGGGYAWKDGPVSEAFRAAKSERVVLLLDELLRIRQRELSILLTALSPDEGVYRIRTGRVLKVDDQGIAQEEVLECPVENLCVVATTNVGSEYAVDDIDPAVAERFVLIRKDTSRDMLLKVLSGLAAAKGFDETVVTAMMLFFDKMTRLQGSGMCRWAPTTRTMTRALELSDKEEEVPEALRAMALQWVARSSQDGKPVAEQLDAVNSAISAAFPR